MEDEIEKPRGLPIAVKIILGIFGLIFLGWLIVVLFSFEGETRAERIRRENEEALLNELNPGEFDDHNVLRLATHVSAKGVPKMIRLAEVDPALLDKTVIGLDADGVQHAYIIDPGSKQKDLMLITTSMRTVPIVLLHNYRQNKTFAYTRSMNAQVIEVAFGGYDQASNIALMFGDSRYDQASPKMPFDSYPFEVMTLREWSDLHPETLVNVDEALSDLDYFQMIQEQEKQ